MLYEIEYWCLLCNKWLSLQQPPFEDLGMALHVSRTNSTRSRPLRVVDDFGNVYQ